MGQRNRAAVRRTGSQDEHEADGPCRCHLGQAGAHPTGNPSALAWCWSAPAVPSGRRALVGCVQQYCYCKPCVQVDDTSCSLRWGIPARNMPERATAACLRAAQSIERSVDMLLGTCCCGVVGLSNAALVFQTKAKVKRAGSQGVQYVDLTLVLVWELSVNAASEGMR